MSQTAILSTSLTPPSHTSGLAVPTLHGEAASERKSVPTMRRLRHAKKLQTLTALPQTVAIKKLMRPMHNSARYMRVTTKLAKNAATSPRLWPPRNVSYAEHRPKIVNTTYGSARLPDESETGMNAEAIEFSIGDSCPDSDAITALRLRF